MKHKTRRRILVLFTGRGKSDWFGQIERGDIPDSVLHTLVRTGVAGFAMRYEDTSASQKKDLFGSLIRSDVVVCTDTTPLINLVLLIRAVSGIGPVVFLVALNTSVLLNRNGLRRVYHIFFWKRLAGIACLARFQMKDLHAAGVDPTKLTFIPLGIDAAFMQAGERANVEAYILSVGFDAGRDYEYLLRIAPHVPHPIRIVAHEKNIPLGTRLPPNVTVEYDIPITEVRRRMHECKFVVIPTKENTGSDCSGQTVLLQALAAGKAVCASARPWIRDYLTEGEEFIALPDGDERAAAQVLCTIWADDSLRSTVARAGAAMVTERFTTEHFAHALAEFISRRTAQGNKNPSQ